MIDRLSLFKLSGLPDSFGVILLCFSFILLLAPYFSGGDFGLFKIPKFTESAKKWLKKFGPVLFVLCLLTFVPLIKPQEKQGETSAAQSPTPVIASTEPPKHPTNKFLGALDGIYVSSKKNQLTVNWENRSFSLLHFNCSIDGNIVEADGFWKIVVVSVDGICSLIDDDDIGKEVGKITPEKGSLSNSGLVGRALVNFEKASLAQLSGVYEFKYRDLEDLRRQNGLDN